MSAHTHCALCLNYAVAALVTGQEANVLLKEALLQRLLQLLQLTLTAALPSVGPLAATFEACLPAATTPALTSPAKALQLFEASEEFPAFKRWRLHHQRQAPALTVAEQQRLMLQALVLVPASVLSLWGASQMPVAELPLPLARLRSLPVYLALSSSREALSLQHSVFCTPLLLSCVKPVGGLPLPTKIIHTIFPTLLLLQQATQVAELG
ncbi:hypothetical protein cyc_06431 [Cyclospora cayetanensis]|uniref:Uncharacterized protein n=1 Tax=Cyclospora cayetanensis TaxID=88456 RepID=A0A1D3CUF1_9EIME|nr:hypothetical protein cyc_06431 [Cyclospora cayetanensis]